MIFKASKDLILSAKVLAHYDPILPLKWEADASAYGLGAVFSHIFPWYIGAPYCLFESRTIIPSEHNFAQNRKEAWALVLGMQHFHQYLYGRKFTLVTNHKPWMTISQTSMLGDSTLKISLWNRIQVNSSALQCRCSFQTYTGCEGFLKWRWGYII